MELWVPLVNQAELVNLVLRDSLARLDPKVIWDPLAQKEVLVYKDLEVCNACFSVLMK